MFFDDMPADGSMGGGTAAEPSTPASDEDEDKSGEGMSGGAM